jgi:hypothetical protein
MPSVENTTMHRRYGSEYGKREGGDIARQEGRRRSREELSSWRDSPDDSIEAMHQL